jgi:hypothetical protein
MRPIRLFEFVNLLHAKLDMDRVENLVRMMRLQADRHYDGTDRQQLGIGLTSVGAHNDPRFLLERTTDGRCPSRREADSEFTKSSQSDEIG